MADEPKNEIPRPWRNTVGQIPRPNVFDRLGGRVTQQGDSRQRIGQKTI